MKLLNVEQVSNMLNIKVGTLYVWVHQKKIPFVKLGKKLLFEEGQLIDFVTKNTFTPDLF